MLEKINEAVKIVNGIYNVILSALSCVLCMYLIVGAMHIIAAHNESKTSQTKMIHLVAKQGKIVAVPKSTLKRI